MVRARPDQLLVAKECGSFLSNPSMIHWTRSIKAERERRRAFALLSSRPILNSGFAAGTAAALMRYFQAAHRLRNSADMHGSTDWGDQVAMNLYCYSTPNAWCLVEERWNYCLVHRTRGECSVNSRGYLQTRTGAPVHVVHGNARTFLRLPGFWRIRKRVPTIIA